MLENFFEWFFGAEATERWEKSKQDWNAKYPNDKHPTGKLADEKVNSDWVTNPEKWDREHDDPEDQYQTAIKRQKNSY